MKLTCVLIVAVLFLTACQLITADDSSDLHEFSGRKMIERLLKTKDVKAKQYCAPAAAWCNMIKDNCCNYCKFLRCA
uniref:Conotoxin n=1 Tax=Conus praecellens TaxID=128530 RepID=A0A291C2N3_CONPC|nr:conotoxin [Conus praecellens]